MRRVLLILGTAIGLLIVGLVGQGALTGGVTAGQAQTGGEFTHTSLAMLAEAL